jgi:hypothetical protein
MAFALSKAPREGLLPIPKFTKMQITFLIQNLLFCFDCIWIQGQYRRENLEIWVLRRKPKVETFGELQEEMDISKSIPYSFQGSALHYCLLSIKCTTPVDFLLDLNHLAFYGACS